jgi:hypothetical protein
MSHLSMAPLVPLIAHDFALMVHDPLFALMVHDPLFALMAMRRRTVHSVVPTSKESERRCRRRCCIVPDGTARTTMSIIATRSNVRAVSYLSAGNTHKLVARMKFS